jgi:hypothetical protein
MIHPKGKQLSKHPRREERTKKSQIQAPATTMIQMKK